MFVEYSGFCILFVYYLKITKQIIMMSKKLTH